MISRRQATGTHVVFSAVLGSAEICLKASFFNVHILGKKTVDFIIVVFVSSLSIVTFFYFWFLLYLFLWFFGDFSFAQRVSEQLLKLFSMILGEYHYTGTPDINSRINIVFKLVNLKV